MMQKVLLLGGVIREDSREGGKKALVVVFINKD